MVENFKYTLDNIDYCIKIATENKIELQKEGLSIYSDEVRWYIKEINYMISVRDSLIKKSEKEPKIPKINILNENYKQLSLF